MPSYTRKPARQQHLASYKKCARLDENALFFSIHFFGDPIRAPKCLPDSYGSIRICAYDFTHFVHFGHAKINFMESKLLARA